MTALRVTQLWRRNEAGVSAALRGRLSAGKCELLEMALQVLSINVKRAYGFGAGGHRRQNPDKLP